MAERGKCILLQGVRELCLVHRQAPPQTQLCGAARRCPCRWVDPPSWCPPVCLCGTKATTAHRRAVKSTPPPHTHRTPAPAVPTTGPSRNPTWTRTLRRVCWRHSAERTSRWTMIFPTLEASPVPVLPCLHELLARSRSPCGSRAGTARGWMSLC